MRWQDAGAETLRSQSVAQPDEGALVPLARPLRKFNLKIRAFKRVLNLGAGGRKGRGQGEG